MNNKKLAEYELQFTMYKCENENCNNYLTNKEFEFASKEEIKLCVFCSSIKRRNSFLELQKNIDENNKKRIGKFVDLINSNSNINILDEFDVNYFESIYHVKIINDLKELKTIAEITFNDKAVDDNVSDAIKQYCKFDELIRKYCK